MNKNKIVTVNGKQYDAVTGMPIKQTAATGPAAVTKKPTPAAGVHRAPQKSQTLIRRVTKKPASAQPVSIRRKPGQTMDIARSSSISRFAPHPTPAPKKPATVKPADIPATHHPIVAKAHHAQATKKASTAQSKPLSSQQIKQQAIAEAMAKPTAKPVKNSFLKRHPRFISIFSASIVVAILAGYLTYLNMPSLSVRVASVQAGINATYPEYRPDGYSLNGPVTFSDGQVSIHYIANTGSTKFDITQTKSSWDSTAVLDNIVRKSAGEKYITSQEQGLTIYTYSGNAAWVNAGILYTIQGDAPLSGEQIRHIATSL